MKRRTLLSGLLGAGILALGLEAKAATVPPNVMVAGQAATGEFIPIKEFRKRVREKLFQEGAREWRVSYQKGEVTSHYWDRTPREQTVTQHYLKVRVRYGKQADKGAMFYDLSDDKKFVRPQPFAYHRFKPGKDGWPVITELHLEKMPRLDSNEMICLNS